MSDPYEFRDEWTMEQIVTKAEQEIADLDALAVEAIRRVTACPRCGWAFTARDRYCWRCYITEGSRTVTFAPPDDGRDYFNTGEDGWDKDAP